MICCRFTAYALALCSGQAPAWGQIHYAVLLILTNLVNPVFFWTQSKGLVGMVEAAFALSALRLAVVNIYQIIL